MQAYKKTPVYASPLKCTRVTTNSRSPGHPPHDQNHVGLAAVEPQNLYKKYLRNPGQAAGQASGIKGIALT